MSRTNPADRWTRLSSFGTSDIWVQVSNGFLIIARDGGEKPDVDRMVLLDKRQAEQIQEFVEEHPLP